MFASHSFDIYDSFHHTNAMLSAVSGAEYTSMKAPSIYPYKYREKELSTIDMRILIVSTNVSPNSVAMQPLSPKSKVP